MKLSKKSLLCLLLVAVMALQFCTAGVLADNSGVDDYAAVNVMAYYWGIDENGNRALLPYSGDGFSYDLGSYDANVATLRSNGASFTAPSNYYIEGIYIVPEGTVFSEYDTSLTRIAKAAYASTTLRLTPDVFGISYWSDKVSNVFNGIASSYTIEVLLKEITYETGHISYYSGNASVSSALTNDGTNDFDYPAAPGGTTHTIRTISDAAAAEALSNNNLQFTGWQVEFANGASFFCDPSVEGYREITPYVNVSLTAQWKEAEYVPTPDPEPVPEPIPESPVYMEVSVNAPAAADYDGNAHYADSFSYDPSLLKEGHSMYIQPLGGYTEPGTYDVYLDSSCITITDAYGNIVNDQYSINIVNSYAQIVINAPVQVPVYMEVSVNAPAAVDYDGNAHYADSFSYDPSLLKEGHSMYIQPLGGYTEPGTYAVYLDSSCITITDAYGNIVNDQYSINIVNSYAQIVINAVAEPPVYVEVSLNQPEAYVYDGTAHYVSVNYDSYLIKAGQNINIPEFGPFTEPGTYDVILNASDITVTDGNGTDVTDQYSFNVTNGYVQLVINAPADPVVNLEISMVQPEPIVYDGNDHYVDTFNVDYSLVKAGHNLNVPAVGPFNEPGMYNAYLDASTITVTDGNGTDVTDQYSISVVNSPVEVTIYVPIVPQDLIYVTISPKNVETYYTGEAIRSEAIVSDGLVDGDEINITPSSFVYSVDAINPGYYENVITIGSPVTITRGGADVTSEYVITLGSGSINILERTPVTIQPVAVSAFYTGSPVNATEAAIISGALKDGDVLDATVTGSLTDPGTAESSVESYKILRGDADVTGEYAVTCEKGLITVTAKNTLVLSPKDVVVPYTGAEVKATEYNKEGELKGEDVLEVVFSGSQTEPGTATSRIESARVLRGGEDVSSEYSIDIQATGLITVLDKSAIVIKPKDVTADYNSYSHEATEFEYTGTLTEGDRVVATVSGSQTYPGESASKVESYKILRGEEDVTNLYNVSTAEGKIIVTGTINVVIRPKSVSKTFDGTPLSASEVEIMGGKLVEGDVVVAEFEGTRTDVGYVESRIIAVKVMRGDSDVTSIYSFDTNQRGMVTVEEPTTKISLTIRPKAIEKVYDGKETAPTEVEILSGDLIEGDKLVCEFNNSLTNIGSIDTNITSAKVMRGEVDVSPLYFVSRANSSIKINPRPVVLKAADASKIADGQPLSKNEYMIEESTSVAEGQTLSATVYGSITAPGEAANIIDKNSVRITDALGNNVTSNYEITCKDGLLKVIDPNKKPDPADAIKVTVSVDKLTKVYDGTPLTMSNANVKITSGSLPQGYTLETSLDNTSIVNAGRVDVRLLSVHIKDRNGNLADDYFNITTVPGSLEITKRPLVIKTGSASKLYNGKPLTEYSATADGKLDGHLVYVKFTGSQTNVGSSRNTVEEATLKVYYKITNNGVTSEVNVTDNYAITYDYGTLIVNPANNNNGTNNNNNNNTKPVNPNTPLTGDTANPKLWIGLMIAVLVIAAGAVAAVIIIGKKKNGAPKHKGRH